MTFDAAAAESDNCVAVAHQCAATLAHVVIGRVVPRLVLEGRAWDTGLENLWAHVDSEGAIDWVGVVDPTLRALDVRVGFGAPVRGSGRLLASKNLLIRAGLLIIQKARNQASRRTGPPRSSEGCRDPRSIRGHVPYASRGACPFLAMVPIRVRHVGVTTWMPTGIGGGFDDEIGLTYVDVTPEGATAQLTISEKHLQPHGIVHGGVYSAIVESVASVSAATWLQAKGGGSNVVGVNNNTDFLRAITAGMVTAVSTPIHRGRRQQIWLIEISDTNDKMVARGQVRLQNLPTEE